MAQGVNPDVLDAPLRDALAAEGEGAGTDPAALGRVALAFWRGGDVRRSAILLERAAGRLARPHPLTSDAHALILTQLGAARTRLGDPAGALAVLGEAIELADLGYSALHLGNALRYRGDLDGARPLLRRAFARARADRDGELAVAALAAEGEVALAGGEAREALASFGRALGITETFASVGHDALTVEPLAGLAQAHGRLGSHAKGVGLAERAARRGAHDRALSARAALALGALRGDAATLDAGIDAADAAPHLPLRVRLLVERARLSGDAAQAADARAAADALGMAGERARLEAYVPTGTA